MERIRSDFSLVLWRDYHQFQCSSTARRTKIQIGGDSIFLINHLLHAFDGVQHIYCTRPRVSCSKCPTPLNACSNYYLCPSEGAPTCRERPQHFPRFVFFFLFFSDSSSARTKESIKTLLTPYCTTVCWLYSFVG